MNICSGGQMRGRMVGSWWGEVCVTSQSQSAVSWQPGLHAAVVSFHRIAAASSHQTDGCEGEGAETQLVKSFFFPP